MKLKTIDLKLNLLFCIALASLLIMSCTKDQTNFESTSNINISTDFSDKENGILLPLAITKKGEYFTKQFLDNSPRETITGYINNYTSLLFLESIGKLSSILKDYNEELNFDEIELENYLSTEELEQLNSRQLKQTELSERGCFYVPVRLTYITYCDTYYQGRCIGNWITKYTGVEGGFTYCTLY